MNKAVREAKVRTSWANINRPYEEAVERFVRALLEESPTNAFLADLRAAAAPLAWTGLLNGLSMAAIKLTSPGVPDIYQGAELWDFSLVDPDNRRAVDYERRRALLAALEGMAPAPEAALRDMLANLPDARAKLYVIWRLLQLRKDHEALFRHGGYTAVRTSGLKARHLVAFTRRHGGEALVTVAPRLIAGLGVATGAVPCDASLWGDTRIELPMFKEGTVLRDVLTGAELRVASGGLAAAALLARFPVAVLRV
jgi:(1->4)-alpha-D-glucan 1-alpha-D-glucosylmutase